MCGDAAETRAILIFMRKEEAMDRDLSRDAMAKVKCRRRNGEMMFPSWSYSPELHILSRPNVDEGKGANWKCVWSVKTSIRRSEDACLCYKCTHLLFRSLS